MATVKTQTPLMLGENYIYPLTTADQVIIADGTRLMKNGTITADDAIHAKSSDDADKLGGVHANEYVLKTDKIDNAAHADNAAMLGGKAPQYYIQPRNLLDNSDFKNPVNQRGVTGGDYNWSYTIDRWLAYGNGFAFGENGVTIPTNGQFAQRIPLEYGQKLGRLFFAIELSTGEVYVTNDSTTTDGIQLVIAYASSNTRFNVIIRNTTGSDITVKNCALYEGSYTVETLPPYVPKGYTAELMECRRYFRSLFGNESYEYLYMGQAFSATSGVIVVPIEIPMRITPTLTKSGTISVTNSAGNVDSTPVTSLSVAKAKDNAISLLYAASGQTTGQATILTKKSASGYVYLSAEL